VAPSDLCRLTIADLSALLAQRELSPVDVVQAHLAQIERLEPRLNCFITLCGEAALAGARAAAAGGSGAAGGRADAGLLGIPVAVKDDVETGGVRSTAGSRVLAEYVPAPTIAEAARDGGPLSLSRNTSPANRTGLPAISLPCGFAAGLPVGLVLIGRPFEEEALLRAAAAYEATTEWHRTVPPPAGAGGGSGGSRPGA
jgi:Asp-tRNA(Asn)/Glu-tRNA(Gln) amidotransferase A subunit family amidase